MISLHYTDISKPFWGGVFQKFFKKIFLLSTIRRKKRGFGGVVLKKIINRSHLFNRMLYIRCRRKFFGLFRPFLTAHLPPQTAPFPASVAKQKALARILGKGFRCAFSVYSLSLLVFTFHHISSHLFTIIFSLVFSAFQFANFVKFEKPNILFEN